MRDQALCAFSDPAMGVWRDATGATPTHTVLRGIRPRRPRRGAASTGQYRKPSVELRGVDPSDGDELDVAGAEGGGVLGQFDERSQAGGLVERQQRLLGPLFLLDALPDPDDQCVDQATKDWPQLILDVFGADNAEGVRRVEEPVEIDRRLLRVV